ncbi:hypothetical protein EDD21DRAFT_206121 [Dissophora ornata]|nr:hypothetical protein EDD21DRAFT_206121 [Dissophora ornata]
MGDFEKFTQVVFLLAALFLDGWVSYSLYEQIGHFDCNLFNVLSAGVILGVSALAMIFIFFRVVTGLMIHKSDFWWEPVSRGKAFCHIQHIFVLRAISIILTAWDVTEAKDNLYSATKIVNSLCAIIFSTAMYFAVNVYHSPLASCNTESVYFMYAKMAAGSTMLLMTLLEMIILHTRKGGKNGDIKKCSWIYQYQKNNLP